METWEIAIVVVGVGLAWVAGREYGTHDGFRQGYDRGLRDGQLRGLTDEAKGAAGLPR